MTNTMSQWRFRIKHFQNSVYSMLFSKLVSADIHHSSPQRDGDAATMSNSAHSFAVSRIQLTTSSPTFCRLSIQKWSQSSNTSSCALDDNTRPDSVLGGCISPSNLMGTHAALCRSTKPLAEPALPNWSSSPKIMSFGIAAARRRPKCAAARSAIPAIPPVTNPQACLEVSTQWQGRSHTKS
jgi:hypothetical protein